MACLTVHFFTDTLLPAALLANVKWVWFSRKVGMFEKFMLSVRNYMRIIGGSSGKIGLFKKQRRIQ